MKRLSLLILMLIAIITAKAQTSSWNTNVTWTPSFRTNAGATEVRFALGGTKPYFNLSDSLNVIKNRFSNYYTKTQSDGRYIFASPLTPQVADINLDGNINFTSGTVGSATSGYLNLYSGGNGVTGYSGLSFEALGNPTKVELRWQPQDFGRGLHIYDPNNPNNTNTGNNDWFRIVTTDDLVNLSPASLTLGVPTTATGTNYSLVRDSITGLIKQQKITSGSGGGAVSSVFGRTGAVTAQSSDYDPFYPLLVGTYNNPTWINTLAYSKITGVPSFITTETDPTVPAYAKTLTAFSVIKTSTDALYEPIFSKNTGFNKNFGTASGTVAEGNDSRIVNSLSKFGYLKLFIKSTGENKLYTPASNTNASRGIMLQQAFTDMVAGDVLEVGSGDYFLTTSLTLKDSVNIIIKGATIYHTNTSIDVFIANSVNNVSITGNGLIRGSGSSTSNSLTSEAGLRTSGDCDNFRMSGINFSGFSGVAIYYGSSSSTVPYRFVNGLIENCNISNNNVGVYTESEHVRLENITVNKNKLGIYGFGGNLQLTNSYVSYNVRGIEIGGVSGNAGHGIIGNTSIIHNSQMGIKFDAVTIGMAMNGNKFAGVYPAATTDSTIIINASRGVHFTGGQMLSPMQIYLTGTFTGYNSIRGAFFYSGDTTIVQPNIVGTTLQKGFLRIEQSSYLDKLVTPLGTPIDILEGGTGNTTGNAITSTKLLTPRNINGVSFDGTADITVADATKLPLSGGTASGTINAPQLSASTHYLGSSPSSYTGRWVDGGSYVSLDTYNGTSIAKELRLQGSSVTVPTAPVNPTDVVRLMDLGGGVGLGTVTSVSVVTANGVSGSVANSTTTPAITLSLGNITPTSVTTNLIDNSSGFTQSNSLRLSGSSYTTPSDGNIRIENGGANKIGFANNVSAIDFQLPTNSSRKTLTVRDISGTVALLSDITGGSTPDTTVYRTVANSRSLAQLQSTFNTKQATLVSGTNIKTINGSSVLGSGDLTVTASLPSLTNGSVVFSNGTTITQDNSNFFWDDTNNRLGIGTTTPQTPLQVMHTPSSYVGAQLVGNSPSTNLLDDYPALAIINTNTTTNNYAGIDFYDSASPASQWASASVKTIWTTHGTSNATSRADLAFVTNGADGFNTRLRITSAGLLNVPGLTASSMLKTDASKNIAVAVSNTDYLPVASPAMTGTPVAPTPGTNINTTQIPTTAWTNTYYAAKASPALTGTPTSTTATAKTNTTQIATTAFVSKQFTATGSGTGAATTITVAHGITGVTSANSVIVFPNNAAAAGISYATMDATNVSIVYTVAPASGTNNLAYSISIK